MKLPIPFLLYVVALGLFGLAGWTFYQMLPIWKEPARTAANQHGMDTSRTLIDKGRGQGTQNVDWVYDRATAPWWATFKDANLIGKLPPPPPDVSDTKVIAPVVAVPMQPLEEIIEIVALVHDAEPGQPDNSYVIVRYQPTVKVDPPEWWVLENTPPAASATAPAAMGRDVIPAAAAAAPRRAGGPDPRYQGQGRARGTPPPSSMPTSGLTGREIMQMVYVRDTDQRHTCHLWPEFANIRLVRVADDARSAWFVREMPPTKEGEKPTEPKEEQLFKTSQNLSQDVMRALSEIQGREIGAPTAKAAEPPASTGWVEVEETMRNGNTFNIGRKDQQVFQQNDQFFDHLDVDVYRGSTMRGLIVRNVDSKLASKFGIQPGEVLLEVNGQPVESKAKALQVGKAQYNRGVRTFVTKWLSNGTVVERTYQAPPK